MLSYSDEVVMAHVQQRRGHLLAEAAAHRLLHGQTAKRADPSHRQPRLADRWLAAVGARLVWWGERLQANARSRQVEMQKIAGV